MRMPSWRVNVNTENLTAQRLKSLLTSISVPLSSHPSVKPLSELPYRIRQSVFQIHHENQASCRINNLIQAPLSKEPVSSKKWIDAFFSSGFIAFSGTPPMHPENLFIQLNPLNPNRSIRPKSIQVLGQTRELAFGVSAFVLRFWHYKLSLLALTSQHGPE